jgi:alkylation response protein AidB-like acyl-CoA dehydrogenase
MRGEAMGQESHLMEFFGKECPHCAAMAKAFAADTGMQVTTNAVQIYGGMGYTRWHPVEKLMRDAKVIQIYEGTAQIMRLIIARRILEETEKALF